MLVGSAAMGTTIWVLSIKAMDKATQLGVKPRIVMKCLQIRFLFRCQGIPFISSGSGMDTPVDVADIAAT